MKIKEKIIGIILILTALVIGGIFLYRSLKKPPQEIVTVTEEKEQKITITEEEKKENQLESDFIMENITEEQLEPFRTDIQELAQMLKDWCMKNGIYRGTIGVHFLSEEMMVTEEKCSVMMKTIVDSDHSEEVLILVLDFYPVSNQYNIHP